MRSSKLYFSPFFMQETQMWFQSLCVKCCLSKYCLKTDRILSLDKHRWRSDGLSEWESRDASCSFFKHCTCKLLNRMFIFCFVAKAESSLVKERSDVSGMEHVRGPMVFPYLAVNFKQKMKEIGLYLTFVVTLVCTIRMACKFCFYHSVHKYLMYRLLH